MNVECQAYRFKREPSKQPRAREERRITDETRRKLLKAFKEADTPPDLLAVLAYTLSNSN